MENPISVSPLVVAVNFKEHRSHMSPEALGTLWGISINLAENISSTTTQKGVSTLTGPMVRRFRTRQAHLRYNYLETMVYSDTMFSDKKSVHGTTCAQVFVTTEGFAIVYPMKNKGEAYDALNNFCATVGLPLTIITDNAKEEYGVIGTW